VLFRSQHTTSVAFPVRITAASAVMMSSESTLESPPQAADKLLQQVDKQKKLKLPPQVLPIKLRKLRVRLNRSVTRKWLAEQQKQKQVQLEQEEPSQAPATASASTATSPLTLSQEQRQLAKKTAAKNVKYPVPMPVLEVKAESEVADVQQSLPEQSSRLEVNEAPPSLLQVVAPIPRTVSNAVVPLLSFDNSNSSSSNSVPAPSGNSSDVHTFGTTKMFSFLYPSRYQRSYSNVGLDYCCPNFDGPMPAIDPTRLHSKVAVPVLELPQFMVITTKIISKQDKNIPPKVRAKLEQMTAKDGLSCVKQKVQMATSTSASLDPSAPLVAASAAPPVATHVERLPKPLPRGPILKKSANPSAAATSAAVAPTIHAFLRIIRVFVYTKFDYEFRHNA